MGLLIQHPVSIVNMHPATALYTNLRQLIVINMHFSSKGSDQPFGPASLHYASSAWSYAAAKLRDQCCSYIRNMLRKREFVDD